MFLIPVCSVISVDCLLGALDVISFQLRRHNHDVLDRQIEQQ